MGLTASGEPGSIGGEDFDPHSCSWEDDEDVAAGLTEDGDYETGVETEESDDFPPADTPGLQD